MNILPASPEHFIKAIALLDKNNLPVSDIHSGTQLFVLVEDNNVIGTVPAEYNFNDALLRSLSVHEEKRHKGLGIVLVNFIEDYLQKQGVQNIYLLTTTATGFFGKRGYVTINRNEVPKFIKQTTEFSTVCPSTATLMKKEL